MFLVKNNRRESGLFRGTSVEVVHRHGGGVVRVLGGAFAVVPRVVAPRLRLTLLLCGSRAGGACSGRSDLGCGIVVHTKCGLQPTSPTQLPP